MLLIPFEKLSIKTNFSKDEIKQRLSNSIEVKYKTKFKDYEFNIPKWVGRGIKILIKGRIKNQSIDVVVRPSYPTIIIMVIFLIIAVGFIFARKDIGSVFGLLILAIIYTYLTIITKYSSKKFMAETEGEVR